VDAPAVTVGKKVKLDFWLQTPEKTGSGSVWRLARSDSIDWMTWFSRLFEYEGFDLFDRNHHIGANASQGRDYGDCYATKQCAVERVMIVRRSE
jgi:hypothetical protein